MRPAKPSQILNSQQGFSLIELMVVVAIIGILSSIAVPNYNMMVSKARQSEAKAMLSNIYTVEQGFSAANNFFTLCLWQAGYAPEGTNRYYLTGFLNDNSTFTRKYQYDDNGTVCPSTSVPYLGGTRNDATFTPTASARSDLGLACPASAFTVTQTTFLAVACGQISKLPVADVWTIDQAKILRNTVPSL